jgi:uncharacterized protein
MSPVLLGSALLMGLLGGTHCVVMCGGIVGVFSSTAATRDPRRLLLYNVGRIASYTFAGALAGGLGELVAKVDVVYGLALGLRVLACLLMLGAGLYLAGALPAFSKLEKLGAPLWLRLEPFARRAITRPSAAGALLVGALWGWLPCGLVYAALGLAVTTGSASAGALSMAAFGAGTLPTLLAMGWIAGRVARLARRAGVRRAAGLAIVGFGLLHVGVLATQMKVWVVPIPAEHVCGAGRG